MTERSRVSDILNACGANPARWPEGERAAAQTLLARDVELQAQARQEAALDDWLREWDTPAPRPQAIAALLEASRRTAQEIQPVPTVITVSAPVRRRERWLANGGAVGLAASLVALLMFASEPAPKPPVDVTDSSVISLAFSAELSEGWM